MDDEDFQRQLELEAAEAKAKQESSSVQSSNPYLYTDPTGTVYEWHHEKKAWFPKIDDNFIAQYQASYGYSSGPVEEETKKENSKVSEEEQEPSTSTEQEPSNSTEQDSVGKNKRKPEEPSWFEVDDEHNTNVYVSNLPTDITEEEFVTLMSKCGLVMKDPDSNDYKIKLYKDMDGNLKGDGLCTYIKVESVDLALQLLDESMLKGKTIRVERAKFTLKGEYDPNKRPKKRKVDKKKVRKKMDKLFDWRPDKLPGSRGKSEMTVILKNMFEVKEFAEDPRLILEYRNDLREECTEKCGPVKKVEIYDNNPEGVAAIHFSDFDHADACIALMNGRFFAGRRLTAESWDGKTRYRVNETEEEAEKRIKEWDKFLDST